MAKLIFNYFLPRADFRRSGVVADAKGVHAGRASVAVLAAGAASNAARAGTFKSILFRRSSAAVVSGDGGGVNSTECSFRAVSHSN